MKPRRSAKTAGDLATMAGQHLLALRAREERRDLGRYEPGQLCLLAFDGGQQSGDLDRDRDLTAVRRDEGDLIVVERSDLGATEVEHARDPAFAEDGQPQQGPEPHEPLGVRLVVLGVGEDVGDLLGLTYHQDPSGHAVATWAIGMLTLVRLDEVTARSRGRRDAEDLTILQVDGPELRVTEPHGAFEDRLEDGGQI